ncbi:MmpS family transport accessory protein [Stackebrandtia soli]|uniref:MmpS family transport accessory protein n=1 Tax=Stackebrandtia soli TaxID=1892856 RepID=UPI0039E9C272
MVTRWKVGALTVVVALSMSGCGTDEKVGHKIRYAVTGDAAGPVALSYTGKDGNTPSINEPLPWSSAGSFKLTGRIAVSAVSDKETDSLRCVISVDDEVVADESGTGTVLCEADIPE